MSEATFESCQSLCDRLRDLIRFAVRQRWHHISQDITDTSRWMVTACAGGRILRWSRLYAVFKPPDAVKKADLPLMHDQFDRIKIFSAVKAPGKIVSGIGRGVKTAAYRVGISSRVLITWIMGTRLRKKVSSWGEKRRVISAFSLRLSWARSGSNAWIHAFGNWVRRC